jgi:putative methyltransferase (TIGR04325 family)
MIKLVVPPVFVRMKKRLLRNPPDVIYGLSGDYHSWDEAKANTTGYTSAIILEKTKRALLKVKSGESIYERDSVLFDKIDYAWPLLAGLMWISAQCSGRLNVLDFGGSLGSTYFQNRYFLSRLSEVRWNIVEQPEHVEIGKSYFEDDYLHFYSDITECLVDTNPNVVLLSGVLQYLEYPYEVFEQILGLPCDNVIIDRTSFWDGPTDRLCIQTVPPIIYPASYPSWIFSRKRFYEHLKQDWENMATFQNPDRISGPVDFSYQGMIIVRSKHLS